MKRPDPLLIILAIAAPILLALFGGGQLAFLFQCHRPAAFSEFPIGGLLTADVSEFGTTATGCEPTTGWFYGAIAAIGLILLGLVLTGFALYQVYKQSDWYYVRTMRRRDGIATSWEVNRRLGPRKAKKMRKTIRPTAVKAKVTDVAWNLGIAAQVRIWITMEESVLLLGAPRSGKGYMILISAIIAAPGAVVTTSTRPDNYISTHKVREKSGSRVTLLDPQGLTGQPTTLKWSPIIGSHTGTLAQQRATALIGTSGLGKSSNNQEWVAPAVIILQSLLHAAALGGKDMDDLIRWGTNMSSATEAVSILKDHPKSEPGWAESLDGVINGDPRSAQNQWFGVRNVMLGLTVSEIRDTLNPKSQEEIFDIDEFILKGGTLYLVATKTSGGAASPFLMCLLDAITERGREIAALKPGGRLDPPMMLVMDEIANFAGAWPGLATLMADGGGVGIQVIAVFQSLAQARRDWGDEAAEAMIDAATVQILLGGANNVKDLKAWVDLAGEIEKKRTSETLGKDRSESNQIIDVSVLTVDELRRTPFGYGFVYMRTSRPIFVELTPYTKTKHAKNIQASKKSFDPTAKLSEQIASGKDTGPQIEQRIEEPQSLQSADGPTVATLPKPPVTKVEEEEGW